MLDVTIVLLDTGISSAAVMPLEIFHAAGRLWNRLCGADPAPRFRVQTVTLDGGPVRTAHGLATMPNGGLADIEQTDIVIVATSDLGLDLADVADCPILPWLSRQHERGATVVGVHAGAAYLAASGLLDGRMATTHAALLARFSAHYPRVRWKSDQDLTEDHRLLCAAGGLASIDVSLYLVERFCDRETAVQCARSLLLPMPALSPVGYAMPMIAPAHDNAGIRSVEAFLHANYRRSDLTTTLLAERARLGERTFVRRFKAATGKLPAAYLQALRIQTAKGLLEGEGASVQAAAFAAGYEDVDFFRTLFKRMTGMNPSEYRAHFAGLKIRLQASRDTAPARGIDAAPTPSRSFIPRAGIESLRGKTDAPGPH